MKKTLFTCLILVLAIVLGYSNNEDLKANFITGDPGIQSVSAITFGPDGILFIGDSQSASLIALDTKDSKPLNEPGKVEMDNIDEAIAALMGTTADAIQVLDMAINPISKNIYLAVQKKDGMPALLKLSKGELSPVALNPASYSKVDLSNPVAEDAKDRRGRSLRKWAISDVSYFEDKVLLTGLSNEEFSSTFRSVSFPFTKKQDQASIEIYHAAHGRYETYAPVKTFMAQQLNGAPHIIASYTCTPLVVFPMDQLKTGQHVKGNTVAELGNRNTPLDIISFSKDGQDYILMANSNRALMKINLNEVANWQDSLSEPVKGNSKTAGVNYLSLPYVNVLQLDKIDDENIVIIQRNSKGDMNLSTIAPNRL